MLTTSRSLWFRLAWPIVLSYAVSLSHVIWPKNEGVIGIVILIPMVASIANIKFCIAQKPQVVKYTHEFQHAIKSWRSFEAVGCFFLLVFEIWAAITWMGFQSSTFLQAVAWYVAYAITVIGARRSILRAYESVLKGMTQIRDNADDDDKLASDSPQERESPQL